jgi:hypothetical protein
MTYHTRVNLYCRHNEVPPCIQGTMTSLSMVPDSQSMVQTNIIKEYPLLSVYSVGTVHHATRFLWKSMAGVFNTFGMRYRFDCTTSSLSSIDSSRHVGSPCDLYGKDFACLSKKTFDKCLQINEKTFNMINRVSAGQLKTNLVRIDMEPGMWWMLVTHMRKSSALASPTHPVYYTDQSTTSLRHSVESTRARTLQCLTDVLPDREVRVRCYVREHIMLLQTMFGAWFGIGPRQKPPAVSKVSKVNNQVAQSVCHGTRVNLITHLKAAQQYGLPLKGWSRIGVEGATYIYGFNKKELCLKVKYASPMMQNALVNIPQHPLANIRVPRVNQYFTRDNVSMKVVGYDDGAFVEVA